MVLAEVNNQFQKRFGIPCCVVRSGQGPALSPRVVGTMDLPDFPSAFIREVRIRVENKGFRTRVLIVHTSLLDDTEYTKEDIAALFRRRLKVELHLRSLKTIMQMEHLRCKKPHRVRNEIRCHMLAYNLIRGVMAESALEAEVEPWQISFKSTLTTVSDMLPLLCLISNADKLCSVLLRCCSQHVVGNRPDR